MHTIQSLPYYYRGERGEIHRLSSGSRVSLEDLVMSAVCFEVLGGERCICGLNPEIY